MILNGSKDGLFSVFYLNDKKAFVRFSNPRSAFIQYKSFRIDLLSGERKELSASDLFEEMEGVSIPCEDDKIKVFHLFYEFGYVCAGMDKLADERAPLAVCIDYQKSRELDFSKGETGPIKLAPLELPKFKHYKKKYDYGRERLLDGDCYQFNLTQPFVFQIPPSIDVEKLLEKFFGDKAKLGAFAHMTHIGPLDKVLLSNSPECLFQYNHKLGKIRSMPIKGTRKVLERESSDEAFTLLKDSSKDQAELFMITDLIRNDLTSIQMIPSEILAKKKKLEVPGLVHQYSVVEAQVAKGLNLKLLAQGLFPGGSITGAPKKRVMEILKKIEGYERGFYCGSTILLRNKQAAGSINIRSAEIDYSIGEIKYCAGGGITLNSNVKGEYDEAFAKVESFLRIFNS